MLHEFMLREVAGTSEEVESILQRDWKSPSRLFFGYNPVSCRLYHNTKTSEGITNAESFHRALSDDYKLERNVKAFKYMAGSCKSFFMMDMEDCRGIPIEEYLGITANVFQYNRRIGDRSAVLWRLQEYFEPGPGLGFVKGLELADDLNFVDKEPKVFWRGSISGSRWVAPGERVGALQLKNRPQFELNAKFYSRIKAVMVLSEKFKFADFKFVGNQIKPGHFLHETGYFEERSKPLEMMKNKYMMCINGNDVASQLYWVASSQSLALKEDCDYEVLPDYFLKPWLHFVPVSKGLEDLEEKFAWCENNQEKCRAIISRANEAYVRMTDAKTWHEAEQTVLSRLKLCNH